jgi:hypothetical protein
MFREVVTRKLTMLNRVGREDMWRVSRLAFVLLGVSRRGCNAPFERVFARPCIAGSNRLAGLIGNQFELGLWEP